MRGPFGIRAALIGITIGIVVYVLLLLGVRALLSIFSPEVGAIVAVVLILAYPAALLLGAILSLRRQRRRQP